MGLRTVSKNLVTDLRLESLRRRVLGQKPGSWVQYGKYRVRINDGANFYMLCKDIFVQSLYHFEARTPHPRILDVGSNIGMSILYFKQQYPDSQITAFEADPSIFPYLLDNIRHNHIERVTP